MCVPSFNFICHFCLSILLANSFCQSISFTNFVRKRTKIKIGNKINLCSAKFVFVTLSTKIVFTNFIVKLKSECGTHILAHINDDISSNAMDARVCVYRFQKSFRFHRAIQIDGYFQS